jgi:transglutaminase-like putative cysteine protease
MDSNALFLTGTPEEVKGDFPRLEVSGTDSISIPGGRWRALRYEAISLIAQLNPAEPPEQEGPYPARLRAAYLQLPELDPRIPQLARYITESQITPYARATAIERYLRTEFGYTLELPAERPPDPLADFLFRRKKGHCEYFASAMAVMLRSIGIPARVASGFQSGLYNSVSHYYTVRASEAHAWVEAYLPGYGWATFDPTPPDPRAFGTLAGLWQYVDALETFWNDWVIEYDVTRQLNLARSVQAEWYRSNYDALAVWERGWDWTAGQWRHWRRAPVNQVLPRALGGLAGLLAVGLAVWAWPGLRAMLAARRVRRGHGRSEDCALLYQRALRQFERRGFVRQSCQTATEFAAAVRPPHCPASAADLFRQITLAYNRARFGRDLEAGRQLPGLIRSLETLPR